MTKSINVHARLLGTGEYPQDTPTYAPTFIVETSLVHA